LLTCAQAEAAHLFPDFSFPVVGDCVVELVGLEPTTRVLWNAGVSDQPTRSNTAVCSFGLDKIDD
jgi:hypothetical protein